MRKTPVPVRRYTVDNLATHPKYDQIVEHILSGQPILAVATKFGVSRSVLLGLMRTKLALALRDGEAIARLNSAEGIRGRMLKHLERVEKTAEACEEFLQDPDNPDKFYLGPRAHEVRVVYYTHEGDKRVRHTEALDALLQRVDGVKGIVVDSAMFGTVDPRKLVVDLSNTAARQLDTLARILDSAAKIEESLPVRSGQAVAAIQQVIINLIGSDPSMRPLIDKLEEALAGSG